MPFLINQGRPSSKYFTLAVVGKIPKQGDEVLCKNHRKKNETRAVVRGHFRYLWAQIPDSFCLLNYGMNSLKLKTALENSFPEFRNREEVVFLLLEEV